MASNRDTPQRGRPTGLQLRERDGSTVESPGPSPTTKRPLNEDGHADTEAKRPRSVGSSISSAGFGAGFPSPLIPALPEGVVPLDRFSFSFRRLQDHTSGRASTYGFVSEAPSRASASNVNQDPLLYAQLTIRNGRDGAANEYKDMMQTLLLPPASIPISERLAVGYSWEQFQAILLSENLEFNKDTDTIRVTLYHNEQVQWEGNVGNGGEFRIAMHQLLRSARGVVERSHAEGENLKVVWELKENLPVVEADRPAQKPAVRSAESEAIGGGISASEEETVPESAEAPADEIDRVTISSDSDSEDVQDDDEPPKITASTDDHGVPASGQDIEDMMEVRDDEAGWRQTCAFFGHDEGSRTIDASHCRMLPGTKRALRPHQMYDVHKIFQSVTNGTGDLGTILAHQMGVGKTITYQAVIAVRRLAFISAAHYKRDPDLHKSPNNGCGLVDRPFGIQCACEKGALAAKIAEGLSPGATLLLVPASIAEQTLREANAYFLPALHLDGLGAKGAPLRVNFIACRDYATEPTNSGHKAAAAAEFKFLTDQETPLPKSTKSTVAYDEKASLKMLADTGVKYSLIPDPDLGTSSASTVLVVTTQLLSRGNSWWNAWKGRISLETRDKREAQLTLGGHYCFGLVVWDEAHQIRSHDTNFAKVLFKMLRRQDRPPMIVAATGSPVTDNLSDMALLFALTRNKATVDDTKLLKKQLRQIDGKLRAGASDVDKLEAAAGLRGILRRSSDSDFLGHPITVKGKPVFETHDCPVDQTYAKAISEFTQTVGNSILEKLRDSRAREPGTREPKTRAAMDLVLIKQDKQLRQLDLAIHFPGLITAWRDTNNNGPPIPTRADELSKVIGKGYGQSLPGTYLHKDIVPPAIWDRLDHILSHSSRLAKLHAICTTARTDKDAYPQDAECWNGFRGPKNVLVFTKWPILAYLIQLWFEKHTNHDHFRSALIHAKLNKGERQEVVDWFRTFTVDGGKPKTFTKVLVTTYGLCGTGLDGLKVANYCLHFGSIKDINERNQASSRVDRQGQPLPSRIYYFESQEQPFDRFTARIRNSRDHLFGGDGLLGEITAFTKGQSNVG